MQDVWLLQLRDFQPEVCWHKWVTFWAANHGAPFFPKENQLVVLSRITLVAGLIPILGRISWATRRTKRDTFWQRLPRSHRQQRILSTSGKLIANSDLAWKMLQVLCSSPYSLSLLHCLGQPDQSTWAKLVEAAEEISRTALVQTRKCHAKKALTFYWHLTDSTNQNMSFQPAFLWDTKNQKNKTT